MEVVSRRRSKKVRTRRFDRFVPVVCTGRETHPRRTFTRVGVTTAGETQTLTGEAGIEVWDRESGRGGDDANGVFKVEVGDGGFAILVTPQTTVRFVCPYCGLDYQRHREDWDRIVDVLVANDVSVLDVSRLPT